ncbi:MAG: leucyl aminopeptidase [Candidatus Kapabacteria bacterium]|nr:leucyl aminopeptidase [Candidatus Kapabacteria bacterium]
MHATGLISQRRTVKADALVVFIPSTTKLFQSAIKALAADVPHIQPLIDSGDFTGKKGSTVLAYAGSALKAPRLILAGLGEIDEITVETVRRAAAAATKTAAAAGVKHCAYDVAAIKDMSIGDVAFAVTEGAMLSQYRYWKYKTTANNGNGMVTSFSIIGADRADQKAIKQAVETASTIVESVNIARDLANAPNNEIYPESLGKRATEIGRAAGFKTTVLDKKKIQALKMGGLLGVNKGSERPPVFIVMEHHGGKKGEKPIVIVGKGVTFDTGGISIKPAAGMSDMKGDMHGAATTIGTMHAVAKLGLKKNVIGLVPATDNMPSGSAIVPGDILTFMNGKTAEIDNTDAEGRLILADALVYADRYSPETVVDLATLTGAIIIALGNTTTGMMGTDKATMDRLRNAASRTSEYVCELPLYEEYEELIKSDYADIKNSGGRAAGSITAALFLKHFVSYPWVHLDIAGTALQPKPGPYVPKDGSGVGVRLLTDMIKNW